MKSFNQIKLKPYEVGEIVVTGKAVNKSYLNPEKNLENKFQAEGEIWHRTGDAGYLDQSNNLWLMGRCAAKIKCAATQPPALLATTEIFYL